MDVKEFIQKFLIRDIFEIQQGHPYHSFSLIAQGIEFLGACIDNNEFFTPGQSKARFRAAITDLFKPGYHLYNDDANPYDIYSKLRCGLAHIVVPGMTLELIQHSEIPAFGNHLEIKQIRGRDRLILVSEDFYNDFKIACEEVITRIDAKTIAHTKVYSSLLGFEP